MRQIANVQKCEKVGCKSNVAGRDHFFCEKHEYQRYYGKSIKIATSQPSAPTWGDIL